MSFVISDAGGLYFIYLTLFGEIKIRYICPNQCLSCSFPNNCLGCTSGYILEAGSCTIENVNPNTSHTNATNEYTYCVNNI